MNLRTIALKIIRGELPKLGDGELAKERLKICEECPEFKRLMRQCDLCGCLMDLKAKLIEARCPVNKW